MNITRDTLAASALLAFTICSAPALTVPVAEDTHSTAAGKLTPATGKSMSLAVSATQTAFIRFNLSDPAVVPTAIVPGNIVSATLRLFVESASKNPGDLTVHAVTSAWTESPATPTAPLPTVDATVLATIPGASLVKDHFISVDVTAAVQAALGVDDYGFAIETTSGAKVFFGSKEGHALGYAAELEIEANLAGATVGDLSGASITLTGAVNAASATISGALMAGSFASAGDLGGANATLSGALSAASASLSGALNAASLALTGDGSGVNLTLSGNLTLPMTTASTGIIYAGATPLLHAFHGTNFFGGVGAGNLTMLGVDNTGIGFQALALNNLGSYNAALGFQALRANAGGVFNTATGFQALYANTSGFSNTATGAGALEANTVGFQNTASSDDALAANINGNNNTASGYASLFLNQSGSGNTATGFAALYTNTADNNTAIGYSALYSNTAANNTATGYSALYSNTIGTNNTADGYTALYSNTLGRDNVAEGYQAMYSNVIGNSNTASGVNALFSNFSGIQNIAGGTEALFANTSGNGNCAVGFQALFSNTQGGSNTAVGAQALSSNVTGNFNIAIGSGAGANTVGSHNICIGNVGFPGGDGFIQIGDSQTATYIAGIFGAGSPNTAVPVYVDTLGKLVTGGSSQRFKESIRTMDDASDVLLQLRPVTFCYKPKYGPPGVPQFGLIAEEVNAVCPDLVVHNADGEIYTVRYDAVNAMLLNEFLKEHRRVGEQERRLADQAKEIGALTTRLEKIERQLERLAVPSNSDVSASAE